MEFVCPYIAVLQNTSRRLRTVGLKRIGFLNLVCREEGCMGTGLESRGTGALPPRMMGHGFGPGPWELAGVL